MVQNSISAEFLAEELTAGLLQLTAAASSSPTRPKIANSCQDLRFIELNLRVLGTVRQKKRSPKASARDCETFTKETGFLPNLWASLKYSRQKPGF
ncbi:MAG: hypothetical protein WBA89_16745 [Microcoleus sp.]|uniref:hypothetical protein n=1 Tax=Microcoleus sp. TaxID=44472 RepID=UPI003C792861